MKFNEWVSNWAKRQAREYRDRAKRDKAGWLPKTERESNRRILENRQESHAISVSIYLRAVVRFLGQDPPNRMELEAIEIELRTLKLAYQNLRQGDSDSPRRIPREDLEKRFLEAESRISNYEELNGVSLL
jgi:hypothetical protein